MTNCIPEEIQNIASQIGQFYYNKIGDYKETCTTLEKLKINRLELKDGKLIIETSRPGLLIGKKGQNQIDLEKYLKVQILIEETPETILDYMIPYPEEHADYGR